MPVLEGCWENTDAQLRELRSLDYVSMPVLEGCWENVWDTKTYTMKVR